MTPPPLNTTVMWHSGAVMAFAVWDGKRWERIPDHRVLPEPDMWRPTTFAQEKPCQPPSKP